jgi:endonuclease/exonuclease/phosphatase family metal-dependent hydrolase
MDGPGFLSGIIYTIPGLRQDVAQAKTDFKNTKKPWKSDRSAIALTVGIGQGSGSSGIRIINSHIDGDPRVHNKQFSKLTSFIKNQSKEGRPTIFCGDLNSPPEIVIPAMAEIGFITPQTGSTQIPPKSNVLDYCSYTTSETLGLANVKVLDKPHTDHYPMLIEWQNRLER